MLRSICFTLGFGHSIWVRGVSCTYSVQSIFYANTVFCKVRDWPTVRNVHWVDGFLSLSLLFPCLYTTQAECCVEIGGEQLDQAVHKPGTYISNLSTPPPLSSYLTIINTYTLLNYPRVAGIYTRVFQIAPKSKFQYGKQVRK